MIRLHNFYEHPEQNRFMVYEFAEEEAAIYFEQMLLSKDLPYEKSVEERGTINYHLFGVNKRYLQEASHINNTTLLKYKQPFIPVPSLRWLLFGFTVAMLVLAVVSYIKTQA